MIAAPLIVGSSVTVSALGAAYWIPIASFFVMGALIHMATPVVEEFAKTSLQEKYHEEPPWFVALTPTYLAWIARIARLNGGFLRWATWVSWSFLFGFFLFLVVHAVLDFATG